MAAYGLQSQFRRSPPYASCIDRCRTVHHDAFTTPNSHRGARRACRAAAGRRRGGAGAAFLRRLPRQSVQPRRAAVAAAPARAAVKRTSRTWRRPTPAICRCASTAWKARCASSPARSSNCSTATSSSRCSSSACRTTPSIASSSSAPRADCPPARATARDVAAGAGQCAAGRRARQPLRRVRSGAASECARRAARARQRSGGRPARRMRTTSRRSARPAAAPPGAPLDLSTLAGNAPAQPEVPRWPMPAPMAPSQLPPPPARNTSATGAQLATLPPSATPKDEYDMAYGYVLHKDYALAEQAFRDFLRKYPNERLVPDAQYWLGESLFQRQRYRDAAESFLAVSTKFEHSGKAPDALLRLGQSLAALQSEGSGLRHAGRSRAQISARLGEREARRRRRNRSVPTAETAAVSAAEAKSLFSDLDHLPALVLAVSGGPDSTALMVLAARWRKALKAKPKLIAVTVDHGLRTEAKREAAAVERLARKLGIAHRTLRWTGAQAEDRLAAGGARGALPPARRRGAQGERLAHPHRAHARRSGRDRADPHEPRQRHQRARGDGADFGVAGRRRGADRARPPAARHSEGAARSPPCARRKSRSPTIRPTAIRASPGRGCAA